MMAKLKIEEEKALREFKETLLAKYGGGIKMMLLYGSKAKGTSHRESDVDVFVLVDKENYILRDEIVGIAFDLLLKYNVDISPRVVGMVDFEQLKRWQTSFIKDVLNQGIKI
jgi:predicted nucleotidyltransferase